MRNGELTLSNRYALPGPQLSVGVMSGWKATRLNTEGAAKIAEFQAQRCSREQAAERARVEGLKASTEYEKQKEKAAAVQKALIQAEVRWRGGEERHVTVNTEARRV